MATVNNSPEGAQVMGEDLNKKLRDLAQLARLDKEIHEATILLTPLVTRFRSVYRDLRKANALSTEQAATVEELFAEKLQELQTVVESQYALLLATRVIHVDDLARTVEQMHGVVDEMGDAVEGLDQVLQLMGNVVSQDWRRDFDYAKEDHRDELRKAIAAARLKFLHDPSLVRDTVTLLKHDKKQWSDNDLAKELWNVVQELRTNQVQDENPKWFVPDHEIELPSRRILDEGGFGVIHLAKWAGCDVVVKVLRENLLKNDREIASFVNEVNIGYNLQPHPFIISLFGACHTRSPPLMVFEHAQNGNLSEYLSRNAAVNWASLLHQASLGLQHLHKNNIVHGDLKLNNILVMADGQVKLADFGQSRRKDTSAMTALTDGTSVGAIRWRAPECFDNKPTFESDIYSFGMCIYEAASGVYPYDDTQGEVVKSKICAGKPPRRVEGVSDHVWRLIERTTSMIPSDRMRLPRVTKELEKWSKNDDLGCTKVSLAATDPASPTSSTADASTENSTSASTVSSPSNGTNGNLDNPSMNKAPLSESILCTDAKKPTFLEVARKPALDKNLTTPHRSQKPPPFLSTPAELERVSSFKVYHDGATPIPPESDPKHKTMFVRMLNHINEVPKARLCTRSDCDLTTCDRSHSYMEVMRYNPLFKRLICRQPHHYQKNENGEVVEDDGCVCIHVDTGETWDWMKDPTAKRAYCIHGARCTNSKCFKSHSHEEICWYNPAYKVKKCANRAHDYVTRGRGSVPPPPDCNFYHLETGDKRELKLDGDHVGKKCEMLFAERTHKPLADALEALREARAISAQCEPVDKKA